MTPLYSFSRAGWIICTILLIYGVAAFGIDWWVNRRG